MLKHISGLPGVYPVPGKRLTREAPAQTATGDNVTLYGEQQAIPGRQAFTTTPPISYTIPPEMLKQTATQAAAATNASFTVSATPGPLGFVIGTAEFWLQDDCKNNGGELLNFRLCTDPLPAIPGSAPSREGLDELNISGSSQFSRKGLAVLKERIPGKNIIMIDLREESHFYDDERVYSWRNPQNNVNKGADGEELQRREAQVLRELERHEGTVKLISQKAISEKELCRQSGIGYHRIPVTDHLRPEDRDVDGFIDFVRTMPKDAWLNFHCKAGKGRTTTFMAMFDMMHNAGKVSADEISQRQFLLGGIDLLGDKPAKDHYRKIADDQRKDFARTFYQYCLENRESNFSMNWSEWKKAKGI